MNSKKKTPDVIQEIDNIKSNLNTQKVYFKMPKSYKPRITRYWLLGFVEGEGSFFALKKDNLYLTFSISQSMMDKTLMESIKDFFNNLPIDRNSNDICGAACLYTSKVTTTRKPLIYLNINQTDYIRYVLIPFFDSVIWRTKKYWDFQDWISILKLKDLGLHYTEEGKKLILLILSNMNNNRLSTSKLPREDRAVIQTEIARLLKGPSNYEIRAKFIKSLNKLYSGDKVFRKSLTVILKDETGLILNTFASFMTVLIF